MVKITCCIQKKSGIKEGELIKKLQDIFIPKVFAIFIAPTSIVKCVISMTGSIQRIGIPPRKYDALIDFWVNYSDTIQEIIYSNKFKKLQKDCSAFINWRKSQFILTEELSPVFDADVATHIGQKSMIRFTTLLIRNQNLTFDEFRTHHKERHIKLFSSVPVIQKNVKRYVVSHCIFTDDKRTPFEKYDGIVEFWFDNIVDAMRIFIDPVYLSRVRPDEHRFLELRKCDFVISKELPPIWNIDYANSGSSDK